LALIKHDNIIRILDVREHDSKLVLVLELAENGSLYNALHRRFCGCVTHLFWNTAADDKPRVDYSLSQKLSWLKQIASALAYLHTYKPLPVLHRDVKPQNIQLFDDFKTAKLADFGLASVRRPEMTNQRGTLLDGA
jgi:mitogen-activated protein kinase kinase kinase 7